MSHFDYRHTCPDINRNIYEFQNEIESYLGDMLDECCPMLKDEQRKEFIKPYVKNIYDVFESSFENVRDSNTDMRDEANRQLDELENELSEVQEENKELNENIKTLENEIYLLNSKE
jgi:ribosome recycling factor